MPWIYTLALRSALRRAELDRVVLHHSHDLSEMPFWSALSATPKLELRRLDAFAVLECCRPYGARLVDLYRALSDPRAQANVLRVALLYAEGGVYLDTDTLTVRSLADLCERGGVFCGVERLVFPADVRLARPFAFTAAMLRTVARDTMRRLPRGWRWFRRVEHLYPSAVNNAILGAEPKHGFLAELLERMLAVPESRRRVRYELGTTLLQRAVAAYRGSELRVYPPPVFYPLAPEISQHWFRRTNAQDVFEVLTPETRVVHWYASVRTQRAVQAASPAWLRAHARDQLFSALALQILSAS